MRRHWASTGTYRRRRSSVRIKSHTIGMPVFVRPGRRTPPTSSRPVAPESAQAGSGPVQAEARRGNGGVRAIVQSVGVLALVCAASVRCTDRVKRAFVAVIAIYALAALSGCGTGKANDGAPSPTASKLTTGGSPGASTATAPSPSGSPTPAVVLEFTVDGTGPYQIGDKLADLQASPGLDGVTAGGTACPQVTTARGKGVWKDVQFSFHQDGALYLAINHSTAIPTPSGAWLGTNLAQLKTIYAGVQTEELTVGSRKGFLVTTVSGRGILFDLNPHGVVLSMAAADAIYLKASYQHGTNFC